MQPAPLHDLVHAAIREMFGPSHAQTRLTAYQNGDPGDFHQDPLTTRRGLYAQGTHIIINGMPAVIKTYRQASEAQDGFHRPMVLLYLGLTPGEQQSGDRNPKRGITKEGDTLLRRLLVQCAHYILRSKSDSDLKRAGLRIMSNGGHKSVAVTAIARKLAVLLHDLWVMGEVYEPLHNHKPDANSATGADSEVAPTQVT